MMHFRIACISGHHNGRFLASCAYPIIPTTDGTAFEVKDPRRLEQDILPKYFRHSRFQSLVRQLNFYSFKKISKVSFRAAASSCGIMRVTAASGSTRLIPRLMLGSSHPTFFAWYLKNCSNALVNDTSVHDFE